MMKQLYFSIITLFFCSVLLQAQTTVDFNTSTDLTDHFNPSSMTPLFSNGTSGGISDTGAVDIIPILPTGEENWTLKTGLPVVSMDTYTISAFVKIETPNGRAGIGFGISNIASSTTNNGHPDKTLGLSFYITGGELTNNSTITTFSYPSVTLGNWYFIEFSISNTSPNTFDIDFNIYNSDSSGVIGSLHSNQNFTSETNTDLGGVNVTNYYPYFCQQKTKLSKLDDFTYSSASTLSVDSESLNDLVAIYPNPTQDFLQITGLESEEPYKIYNTVGAQVAKGMVSNGKKVEIQNLTNGMYFLKLESGRTFKFLKE